MLSMVVVDDVPGQGGTPRFAALPAFDLRNHVRFLKKSFNGSRERSSILESLIHEETNTPFDVENKSIPPWRVTVLELSGATARPNLPGEVLLLFTCHHALGDGSSCFVGFHRDLMEALRKAASNPRELNDGEGVIVRMPESVRPYPPLEHLIDTTPSFSTRIKKFVESSALPIPDFLRRIMGVEKLKYWAGQAAVPGEAYRTESRLIELSPSETKNLIGSIKRMKATNQPVLTMLVKAALLRVFGETDGSDRSISCTVSTAAIIRPHLQPPVPADLMGFYGGIYPRSYWTTRSKTRFWEGVRNFKGYLNHPSAQKQALEEIGLCASADIYGDTKKRVEDSARCGKEEMWGKENSFEISNIGIWKPPTCGDQAPQSWIPIRAFAALNASTAFECLNFGVITLGGTGSGEDDGPALTMIMGWQDVSLERENAEEIKRLIETGLRRIASGQITEETTLEGLWGDASEEVTEQASLQGLWGK